MVGERKWWIKRVKEKGGERGGKYQLKILNKIKNDINIFLHV